MTRCAESGSTHNKKVQTVKPIHYQPCLPYYACLRPLLPTSPASDREAFSETSHRWIFTRSSQCGEVEDIAGALTPVGCGVAQNFHDLLVEFRLLLVAEVDEGEEEEGQEEGEEVKRGNQVEETTTTWMAMMVVVSGVRTKLELEPM